MSTNRGDIQSIYGDVIIIEENPSVRMLLAETFSELGLTSVAFESTDAAVEHLLGVQGACPLIIADQGITIRFQAIDFIKMAAEDWPSIPAILTAGHFIEDHLIPRSSIYLRKPYTLDQLERTVLSALSSLRKLPLSEAGHNSR